MATLDGQITSLETGYGQLYGKLAMDREVLIMMCH